MLGVAPSGVVPGVPCGEPAVICGCSGAAYPVIVIPYTALAHLVRKNSKQPQGIRVSVASRVKCVKFITKLITVKIVAL